MFERFSDSRHFQEILRGLKAASLGLIASAAAIILGLALNNSNWGPICNLLRFWTLAGAVLTPLACIVTVKLSGFETWTEMNFWVRLLPFLIVLASCYYVGKKYA